MTDQSKAQPEAPRVSVYALNKEMEAASALRESLKASADLLKDTDLVRDMIEGETNLREMIAGTVQSLDEDEIMVLGLAGMVDRLQMRHGRLVKRIQAKRAAIEQAMVIAEIQTLELPTLTATAKRTPANLQITDESIIPADYWKAKDPVLDKRALKQALKDGQEIPGAQLDNGGVALQLRRN